MKLVHKIKDINIVYSTIHTEDFTESRENY